MSLIGEISRVDPGAVSPYIPVIIPHLSEAMKRSNSDERKRVAVWTLGTLAQSTGYLSKVYEYDDSIFNSLGLDYVNKGPIERPIARDISKLLEPSGYWDSRLHCSQIFRKYIIE